MKEKLHNPRFRKVDDVEAPKYHSRAHKRRAIKRNLTNKAKLAWYFIKYRRDLLRMKHSVVSLVKSQDKTPRKVAAWLKERSTEPSTARAVVGFGAVAGLSINPNLITEILIMGASILSLIEFIRVEPKS